MKIAPYTIHTIAVKTLILTAVQLEARAIAAALNLSRASGENGARYISSGLSIELQVVGIGASLIEDSALRSPENLILAGFAGALDPSLNIGDIVIDGKTGCLRALPFRTGRIHTATKLVTTPADKKALYNTTGALAVDMEGSRVRTMAAAVKLPLIHIRAISDTAGQAIDPIVLAFIDSRGRAKPAAVAAGLLRRPRILPDLVELRRNARLAGVALGRAVRLLLDAINRPQP